MERNHRRFTGRAELQRRLAELQGLVEGVEIDTRVNALELAALRAWADRNAADTSKAGVLRDVSVRVLRAIADERITEEERADIVWKCSQATAGSPYFDLATRDMQVLHGVLGGLAADGVVTDDEVRALRHWLERVERLRGSWPYDEVDSVLTAVLSDGRIDVEERAFLHALCADFLQGAVANLVVEPMTEELIRWGVCATQPEVQFQDRTFCFTGESGRGPRSALEEVVVALRGQAVSGVSGRLDYLIVCDEGSPAWAFSCYGRKVEQAVTLRRKGKRVALVREADFWDAVEDAGHQRLGSVR